MAVALSRQQAVHLDGQGKPKAVNFQRLREQFFAAAIRYFACTNDQDRERARERVIEDSYGLTAAEIIALSEAAKLRVAGRGNATSPMIADPTQPNLQRN